MKKLSTAVLFVIFCIGMTVLVLKFFLHQPPSVLPAQAEQLKPYTPEETVPAAVSKTAAEWTARKIIKIEPPEPAVPIPLEQPPEPEKSDPPVVPEQPESALPDKPESHSEAVVSALPSESVPLESVQTASFPAALPPVKPLPVESPEPPVSVKLIPLKLVPVKLVPVMPVYRVRPTPVVPVYPPQTAAPVLP
ncbi:MAG: hypothetical protein LBH00_01060 [Planctomycetaceae bacterium]|jgi:hypothetical protein|nr:hypothetical protein [Planctomycetaceae bacterium]